MKRKRRLMWAIVALIAILGVGTTSVAAKATKTDVFGTQGFTGQFLAPGTTTYPGGNRHLRGLIVVLRHETNVPSVTGNATVVINVNVDANSVGPMWGTGRLEDDDGLGFWEGTWNGYQYDDGTSVTRAVMHGGGAFEGLQAMWTVECPQNVVLFPGTECQITGRVLDPHGG
jgi:hypothetical protein